MLRCGGALLGLSGFIVSASAFAAPPNAEHIKSAMAEYDAGRRAFTDGKYEEAAIHFENAFHDAPNAQTLRNAIRARKQANQLARAGTLAILAQDRYADDEPTLQLSKEVLTEAGPKLFKLTVTCDAECGVAADGRIVSLEEAKRFAFFLQPGPHTIVVSWPGDRTKSFDIKAKEGQSLEQTATSPPLQFAVTNGNATTIGGPNSGVVDQPTQKPFGPAVFITLLGLTAVSGGVLIWSGIDTISNPGTDAVKAGCVGQGDQCALYQQGLSSQLRTNVLIGVTAGLGALTFASIFLTQWSKVSPHALTDDKQSRIRVQPLIGVGSLGLAGTF